MKHALTSLNFTSSWVYHFKFEGNLRSIINAHIDVLQKQQEPKTVFYLQNHLMPALTWLDCAIQLLKQDMQSWRPGFIRNIQISKAQQLKKTKRNLQKYHDAYVIDLMQQCTVDGKICDDDKIVLYDLLKNSSFDLSPLLKLLRQKGYNPPQTKNIKPTSKQDLIIEQALGLNMQPSKPFMPQGLNKLLFKLIKPFRPILSLIFELKHLFALAFSLALYTFFAPPLLLTLSPFLGQSIVGFVNASLFYGVALAPLWALSHKWLMAPDGVISKWFVNDKVLTSLQSLDSLKHIEAINQRLKAGILDTAHYDITGLADTNQKMIKDLKAQYKALSNKTWLERFFIDNTLKKTFKHITTQIKQQIKQNQKLRKAFAKHIVQRVEQDMIRLVQNIDNGIIPWLSKTQINKLTQYVKKQHPASLETLNRRLSLKPQLLGRLKQKQLIIRDTDANPLTPWGQFKPNQASLKGWQLLTSDQQMSNMVRFMQGDLDKLPNLDKHFIAPIQQYIFDCLDKFKPSLVNYLSPAHKREIINWHTQNKPKIQQAEKLIDIALSGNFPTDLNLKALANHVLYLDAMIVVNTLNGKTTLKNKIREAVNLFDGSDPKGFILCRFYPLDQQASILLKLATMRLNWLLNHAEFAQISELDIMHFHNHLIVDFDLTSFVQNHSAYQQPGCEKLLRQFAKYGLDDGTLLAQYSPKHQAAYTDVRKLIRV